MKVRHALLWGIGLLLLYVLSSGPALLLRRTTAWDTLKLDVVYWPMSRLLLTPAYKIILPYWDLWHSDRDTNPLIPG